jgi:hypothetical protein
MLLISVGWKTRDMEADNFGPATGALVCCQNPVPLKSNHVEIKCGVEDEKTVSLKGIFSVPDQAFIQGILVTSLLDLTCFTPKNGVLSEIRALNHMVHG